MNISKILNDYENSEIVKNYNNLLSKCEKYIEIHDKKLIEIINNLKGSPERGIIYSEHYKYCIIGPNHNFSEVLYCSLQKNFLQLYIKCIGDIDYYDDEINVDIPISYLENDDESHIAGKMNQVVQDFLEKKQSQLNDPVLQKKKNIKDQIKDLQKELSEL